MEKGKGKRKRNFEKNGFGTQNFNEKQLTKSEEVPKVAVGTTAGEDMEV